MLMKIDIFMIGLHVTQTKIKERHTKECNETHTQTWNNYTNTHIDTHRHTHTHTHTHTH